MTGAWQPKTAADVREGDRVRLGSGTEMEVTRVEPFRDREDFVCLIEDTAERWLKQPLRKTVEVHVRPVE
jgi:hypothetical protein